MERQNTKFTLGTGQFEVVCFSTALAGQSGLFPMPVTIDPAVGEEIVLYWLDRTPFIADLASVRPFRLEMSAGLYPSRFGPLIWLLFYVPNPQPEPQPFASMECHINPSDPKQMLMLRRLASQTHWHLVLLGAGNRVIDFLEFATVARPREYGTHGSCAFINLVTFGCLTWLVLAIVALIAGGLYLLIR